MKFVKNVAVPDPSDYDVVFKKRCLKYPKKTCNYPDGTIFRLSDFKIIY